MNQLKTRLLFLFGRLDLAQIRTEKMLFVFLGFAVFGAIFVVNQTFSMQKAIRTYNDTTVAGNQIKGIVTKEPLVKSDYARLQNTLRGLTDKLDILPGDNNILIATNDTENYEEWLTALTFIQNSMPNVFWDINTLCSGACDGGRFAQATLVGYRQAVKLENNTENMANQAAKDAATAASSADAVPVKK